MTTSARDDDEFSDPDRVRTVSAKQASGFDESVPDPGDDGRDFDDIFR